jgi:uncharacterized membrane protein
MAISTAISLVINRKVVFLTALSCLLSLPLAVFLLDNRSKTPVNPQRTISLSILRFGNDRYDDQCVVLDINDKSEVVGGVLSAKNNRVQGYVWRKEMGPYPHLLKTPDGFTDSIARTINARGRIAGDAYQGSKSTTRGVRWNKDQTDTLEYQDSNTQSAGIASDETVVGSYGGQGRQTEGVFLGKDTILLADLPFLFWDMSEIFLEENNGAALWKAGTNQGRKIGSFYPVATNSMGVTAGVRLDKNKKIQALIYQNGKEITLPGLSRYEDSIPSAINDNNNVVGAVRSRASDALQPVIWSEGKVKALAVPYKGGGVALAVDSTGNHVVGIAYDENNEYFAAAWHNDKFYNLNLSFQNLPVHLLSATCINNNGTIGGICLDNNKKQGFLIDIKE